MDKSNLDQSVVQNFGKEWETFNYRGIDRDEIYQSFAQYFNIFPLEFLNKNSVGFDMGCGTGRWAQFIAPFVGQLNCVDPSHLALNQAKINLAMFNNCNFECAGVSESILPDESQDFGYSLGVLHHIPDTLAGLQSCSAKLKPGAPFLVYLYYYFDNKPGWYIQIWKLTDSIRKIIAKLPYRYKLVLTNLLAYILYFPLSRISRILEVFGVDVKNIPLSDYRKKSIYILKTDSMDRFGTSLEKRFTKDQIYSMLTAAGFVNIQFSDATPYWVALCYKK